MLQKHYLLTRRSASAREGGEGAPDRRRSGPAGLGSGLLARGGSEDAGGHRREEAVGGNEGEEEERVRGGGQWGWVNELNNSDTWDPFSGS